MIWPDQLARSSSDQIFSILMGNFKRGYTTHTQSRGNRDGNHQELGKAANWPCDNCSPSAPMVKMSQKHSLIQSSYIIPLALTGNN